MTEPHPDLEELAALADGRLSGEARDRALRRLATSSEAYEVFAETVRLREDAKVVRFPAWRRPGVVLPLAAAAALALLLIQPVTQRLRPGAGAQFSGAELIASLAAQGDIASRLGRDWDQRGWSVTRGAPGRLAEPEVAFRLGVRSVDLHLALALGDPALAERLAVDVLELLTSVDLSQAVTAQYSDLRSLAAAGEPTARLAAAASQAERALGELLATSLFTLGQWCAAAELAARTHDPSLFLSRVTTDFLDTATELGLTDEDAGALRRVAEFLADGISDPEYPELQTLLQAIIQRNAR